MTKVFQIFLIAAFILCALWLVFASSQVRADAYPLMGQWASYADYRAQILTADTEATPCSSGVVYLGEHRYSVPQGVSSFRCKEAM